MLLAADATAFGCWDAARRLIERGATTNLYQSANMGLLDRMSAGPFAGTLREAIIESANGEDEHASL